jgi:DNA (cytosine-5)-methyltransferase 1
VKENKETHSIVSFFAGCGLLDLGFERNGFKVLLANEINPEFAQAYKYSREQLCSELPKKGIAQCPIESFLVSPRNQLLSSLVEEGKENGTVGFVGGPPCPDFSVAGKNRGKHGDNGKLTKTYFDVICATQPDWFLFENVKGLWNTKRHRAFYEEMKSQAESCGYILSDHLVNSIEYGAPQDRDRIMLLGWSQHLSDRLGSKQGFPWLRHAHYPQKETFSLPWPRTNAFQATCLQPTNIPIALTVNHWFERNQVATHPNAHHCFKPRAGLARFLAVDEGDDSRKSFKRLHRWRYSPTACYGNNEVHLHPTEPRRITVAEALAIQSVPKGFQLPTDMSLSAMFKTIGNGVPFLLASAIAKTILEHLDQSHENNRSRSRKSHLGVTQKSPISLYSFSE